MDCELTTKVINNDETSTNYKYKYYKHKIMDNKVTIIYGIILLIILCFLSVIVYKLFIKDSSQEQMVEQEKDGDPFENKHYLNLPNDPEFKKFYEIFPFSLKLNENGKADLEHSSLDNTSPSKLIYLKEDTYQFNKIELSETTDSSNSENIDFSVAGNFNFILHCDAKYKSKVEEAKSNSKKSLFLVIKKVLSSLSVKRSDIEINESFKRKIEDIADEDSFTDGEKAMKLDQIFSEYGYFIPLKMNIGGYFYQEAKTIENENLINDMKQLEANANLNFGKGNLNSSAEYDKSYEDFFKNLFSSEKIQIIGGDTSKKSFEEWETSLNYENARIIEYSNFIEANSLIEDFLDKERKAKLKNALNLVGKKYQRRKEYYDNINGAKEYINSITISGDQTKRNGLCYENDLIYTEIINIRGNKEQTIDISFNDIIVGWKINSNRNDGKNSKFTFDEPILTKKVYMKFSPKSAYMGITTSDQKYDVEIFLMKFPE